jgi:predicted MFS family arabinose efflux permease
MLFGLAAVPSVSIWTSVGARVGVMKAFAFACVVEAIGISASVEFQTVAGVCLAATFLGGTFMGLTALGLVGARELSAGEPHRAVALMTASFAIGQMLGPPLAGKLFDQLGSFRVASLVASSALIVAALLVIGLGTNAAPTDS